MIYLCGFMGSGKSTLLRQWSSDWSGEYFDFDEEIAKRSSVAPDQLGELIKNIGWKSFRALEKDLLLETLESNKKGFYSFGGGMMTTKEHWEIVSKYDVHMIWVDTPADVCWRRVKDELHRPLVLEGEQAFYSLYEERKPFYQKASTKSSEIKDFNSFVSSLKV